MFTKIEEPSRYFDSPLPSTSTRLKLLGVCLYRREQEANGGACRIWLLGVPVYHRVRRR